MSAKHWLYMILNKENMITIGFLADYLDAVPTLVKWFRAQWPDYYANWSQAEMEVDFLSDASRDRLPSRLIAFESNDKRSPIQRGPCYAWAGSQCVFQACNRVTGGRTMSKRVGSCFSAVLLAAGVLLAFLALKSTSSTVAAHGPAGQPDSLSVTAVIPGCECG